MPSWLVLGSPPEWRIGYRAQYTIGPNDDGILSLQLMNTSLEDISLPIIQVIRVWMDAQKKVD